MGKLIVGQIETLLAKIATSLEPVEPPKEWTFTVERDNDGFLKEVKAIGK